MAWGDDVTVTIGGDNSGLKKAIAGSQQQLDWLGRTVGKNQPGWQQFDFTLSDLGNSFLNNIGPMAGFLIGLNSFFGIAGAIIGPIQSMISGVVSFGEHLASLAVNIGWDALQQGADIVSNLAEQIFNLNNQTEKNVNTWQFLYGGQQNAANLAAWTQQFSMNIPYTRQDLMNSVTTLGRLGLTSDQIKQYLPTIADLGTLNPNLSLNDVAMAIQGASEGYSRMLRYELGINPQDLRKYGLDITGVGKINNPQDLLPALQAWAKDRGVAGSAQKTTTSTFWGAESSFIDKLQNWALAAGGMNADGTVNKGSFFGEIKDVLNAASAFLSQNQSALTQFATIVSKLFGAGVQTGATILRDFFTSLHATGIDTSLEQDLANFAQWLADPSTQAGIGQFVGLVGQLVGVAGLDLSGIFKGFWNGVTQSGIGQTIVQDVKDAIAWLSDSNNQEMLKNLGYQLGSVVGPAVQDIAGAFKDAGTQVSNFLHNLTPQDILDFKIALLSMGYDIETIVNSLFTLGNMAVDTMKIMRDATTQNIPALIGDALALSHDYNSGRANGQSNQKQYAAQLAQAQADYNQAMQSSGTQVGAAAAKAVADGFNGNTNEIASATRVAMTTINNTVIGHAAQIGDTLAQGVITGIQASLERQMQQDALWGNLQWRRPGGNQAHGNLF